MGATRFYSLYSLRYYSANTGLNKAAMLQQAQHDLLFIKELRHNTFYEHLRLTIFINHFQKTTGTSYNQPAALKNK